jgi:glycosyltransferase involved in cell wall biosynthesis
LLKRIYNRILRHKYRFVRGLDGGNEGLKKRCLLYYKTDPFFNRKAVEKYGHTNLWEILEIVRLLNEHRFVVDVIDRTANDFLPEDIYDFFIGLGAGNSGKYFAKYAKVLKKATKVLYAAGPEPNLSNKLVKERYDQFRERTGIDAPYMRIITEVDFDKFSGLTDYIFCIGEPGTFSFESYKKHNRPCYSILPGTSPDIRFSEDWIPERDRKSFLCFAGDGFICKGVDLLVEAFEQMPDMKLYICGPDSEPAFFRAYGDLINRSNNIFYEGFVGVGSTKFHDLCSKCSFVILNSSSEGCATSVVTCLRAGLVPIVNHETSVNTGDFGFLMEDKTNIIEDIKMWVKHASNLDDQEYRRRVDGTVQESLKYTQASFTESFNNALENIIKTKTN